MKQAQKEAEAAAKTAEYRADEQAAKAKTASSNIMNLVSKYWWIAAIAVGIFVVLPMLKKKVGSRSNKGGARSRTGSAGKAWSRKMIAAKRRKRTTRKK
jgi:hypothetical protein